MIVYITKYALTDGISMVETDATPDEHGVIVVRRGGGYSQFFHKSEWHATEAEALADCRRRRDKKIASLRKQIAKLEKMEFGHD